MTPILDELTTTEAALNDLLRAQVALAEQARKAGKTWQQIADALDITRQAAYERYHFGSDYAMIHGPI